MWRPGFSPRWPLLLQSAGCRRSGFSSRRAPAQGLRPLGPRAGAQYLWCTGLAAPRREESSLDLGPNPRPLHWPVVSYPLHRQGSPHLLQGRLLALRPSFIRLPLRSVPPSALFALHCAALSVPWRPGRTLRLLQSFLLDVDGSGHPTAI